MPRLSDLLSWVDSRKRVAKRNIGDLLTDPANALEKTGYQTALELKNPDNYGPGAMKGLLGMTAWHGSPFKFDKFSLDKIGTGEGAQAYGHGLYLAESPEVARSYQTALAADRGFSFGGKSGLTRAEVQDMVNAKYGAGYLDNVLRPSGVADSFIDDMVTGLNRADGTYPRQYKMGSQRAKLYDELRGQIIHSDPGTLYKTDIPDEAVARFLDWDKPLSQQAPEVQAALEKLGISKRETAPVHSWLRMKVDNMPKGMMEEDLASLGIPGIRYLDGGSRGAGSGTSNFVAFDPEMIRILERNGQPTGLQPWKPGEYKLRDLLSPN